MLEFSHIVYEIVIWLFLLYGVGVFLVYTWMGVYALGAIIRYRHQNTFTDYSIIATSSDTPVFSLIAPAYNEGKTIVENVRSLLSLYYHNLEIIIVNDGSKDDSMQKLITAYELERISFFVQGQLETKTIKGVYKSKNPAFRKLTVIDKENGGKADALNVGINISSGDYVVCIDVDCILEQDAILKLAKPFLEQTDKKVIACGGVIRLANSCKIENGKITEVNVPKSWLGRMQALEYIRAFVLGRMAWSRASGLILISGAFGAFDRKIVLACGGYDKDTVGEDMELVVRMRRYMEERKEPYEVVNIPDPLCWTEVPETKEILSKQRNRWMRGTMETLWKHRKLMFNPRYGKLGMISLPYWFFFEFLGPLVEFSGYIIFLIFLLFGIVNWPFFIILFALVISAGILYSIYAIWVDFLSKQVYTKRKDSLTLVAAAILEPIYFHPIVVKAGVMGFIDYFKKSHSWGEMTRQGFNQTIEHLPWKLRIARKLTYSLKKWGAFSVMFLGLFLLSIAAEWLWYTYNFKQFDGSLLAKNLLFNNLVFLFQLIFGIGILYMILNLIKESWAKIITVTLCTLVVLTQYIFFLYFAESHNMLGADVRYYSAEEMKQILQTSGMLSAKNIALMVILIAGTLLPFWIAVKQAHRSWYIGLAFLCLGFLMLFVSPDIFPAGRYTSDFEQNASKSKGAYFLNSNLDDFINEYPKLSRLFGKPQHISSDPNRLDDAYPFWRNEDTPDFLGEYFNTSTTIPNLVFITIEGLGHAYSSPKGYVGNFTPFIDSLANRSLYWEFNVSSSGRTFAMLPTLTGSLPFGKNGFLEIGQTPPHFNLFNVLKKNGFETGFYYGGDASFDRMKAFLEYSEVDNLIEEQSFTSPYRKLPENNGESWGYEDQAVFSKMLDVQKPDNQPYFNLILTLSTHNPFLINNTSYYEELFQKRVASNQILDAQRKWAFENKKQLVSVLNVDDALKAFFEAYAKRPDFKNTIFLITGDHSMPEIPLQTKIDRYHVPLIIYSPLLKEPKRFFQLTSHFDIAPSILAYYRENYRLKTPSTVAWVGRGFAKDRRNNTYGIPIMQSKNQIGDFIFNNYHLNDNRLFVLKANVTEDQVDDQSLVNEINRRFDEFKAKNARFYSSGMLMPDSVTVNFMSNNTLDP
ncbi:sulfatase-like hydrolase/transferase [Sphingobacterium gobiense]|uniref:Glycosyl transferase n=1 Tax=Sphingobacterium gobiense TaxID=1382456 RepID=A0A2S9JTW4_9SPHI|nr:sulfatase-like hydrolase/transferase [Sphingobacterium gobiense]PRD56670.1 glycosyl transferase [Sphingobacterium gobiense]